MFLLVEYIVKQEEWDRRFGLAYYPSKKKKKKKKQKKKQANGVCLYGIVT